MDLDHLPRDPARRVAVLIDRATAQPVKMRLTEKF
jgi:hypothetical protein